jgi:hypothetical protein
MIRRNTWSDECGEVKLVHILTKLVWCKLSTLSLKCERLHNVL